jgi:hypothetical protein
MLIVTFRYEGVNVQLLAYDLSGFLMSTPLTESTAIALTNGLIKDQSTA